MNVATQFYTVFHRIKVISLFSTIKGDLILIRNAFYVSRFEYYGNKCVITFKLCF